MFVGGGRNYRQRHGFGFRAAEAKSFADGGVLEEGPGEAPVSCTELLKQRLLLSEEAAGIGAVAVFLLWLLGATCGALSYSFYGPFHKEEFDTLSVGAL